jgi:glycosyltransferase involved in cell wall biosynthesis
MNILLSAYACFPYSGSESGIGWNFAKELAKQGNKVTILTKNPEKDEAFTKEIEKLGLKENLSVLYYDLPKWLNVIYKSASASEHLYYFLWQIGLYFFAKKTVKNLDINLIHHITLGVFRTPSFLYLLNIPFVFGPVGGGEECPETLREQFPAKYKLIERLRSLANSFSRYNPLSNQCFSRSQLVLLKTSDNLKFIPEKFHHKCKVVLEVGINQLPDITLRRNPGKIKILYAGRLVYWKGVHIAIKSFARTLENCPDIEFTIVGSGNDAPWIKNTAQQQKVYDKIKWVPYVEQSVLFQMYQQHDLLLFPSLHDSSGGVVLEALSFGLPVICLDLGGPKEIVDSECGYIISTYNLNEDQVAKKISLTLEELVHNPAKLAVMQEHARNKASSFTWDKVISRSYSLIHQSMHVGLPEKSKEEIYNA